MELTTDSTALAAKDDSGPEGIRNLVRHAARLLPSQGPIEVFVHHNTLHAFESLDFHQAVKEGLERYGAQPYLSEQEYRQLLKSGHLTDEDLQAVLKENLDQHSPGRINGLGTREQIRLAMLRHPVHVGSDAELQWIIAETDTFDRFRAEVSQEHRERIVAGARQWLHHEQTSKTSSSVYTDLSGLLAKLGRNAQAWNDSAWEMFSLHLLWRICCNGIQSIAPKQVTHHYIRPRDLILNSQGEDIDRNVHDL